MPRAPYGVATELRVRGLGPVLDRGFVAALKSGDIELVPAVERFAGQDVVLAGGARVRPDPVIAATGYRHGLEELVGHLGVLLPTGKPAVLGARTHPDAPGLYFNGYWLPASGQLPAMRRTSRRIARAVARERGVDSAALGRLLAELGFGRARLGGGALSRLGGLRGLGDERRLEVLLDRLLGHDALRHVAARGQLELHLEQDLLEDRAQAARAGVALERLVGDRAERVVGEVQLDPVEAEEALELLDERVARLRRGCGSGRRA